MLRNGFIYFMKRKPAIDATKNIFITVLQKRKQQRIQDVRKFSTTSIKYDQSIPIHSFEIKDDIVTCGSLLNKFLGKDVILYGWVNNVQNHILELRDGFGLVRCTLCTKHVNDSVNSPLRRCFVKVIGTVLTRHQSEVENFYMNGDIEVELKSLNIVQRDVSLETAFNLINKEYFTSKEKKVSNSSKFSIRTHTCGELTIEHVGTKVTLCGWLKFCRPPRFLILEDAYGATQCLSVDEKLQNLIYNIPLESVLLIDGIVAKRPTGTLNKDMTTGEIEVAIKDLQLLNPALNLPFNVRHHQKPTEKLSLKHRYLSLRFPEMQHNLRIRSTMFNNMRKFLVDLYGFVEVETPTLFCRTPGGAREFIVPTKHKGDFFCLVQSPQQFKQMLMVGGIDKYFQIARCYRDEATRPDRQPEFTQLDIELSFAKRDDILSLIEELLVYSYPKAISSPFQRMTYFEALENYGSDKPDISYGLKLQNITDLIKRSDIKKEICASCLVIKQSEGQLSNTFNKNLRKDLAILFPDVQIFCYRIPEKAGTLENQHLKDIITLENFEELILKCNLGSNDVLFVAYGPYENVNFCLGACRTKVAEEFTSKGTLHKNNELNPLWIVDFPLFRKGKNGEIESCHHPFTAPHAEDVPLLDLNPFKVRALSYDLVFGGQEIGGGSVRVHSTELQEKLLHLLNIEAEPLKYLLKALQSGCPPHAGIALGLDRLTAFACDANAIRDVIAFPKSSDGTDPLSGAPSAISKEELQYYKIKVDDSD